ncbi:DNA-processing protein DprA [Microbacterium sp. 179-B 1A2 NHS]|uniref:DNA-processing protein DprA n=1 Tax=Microbacterium sp. 179-B 1A2 NHS TaxID=3142383 RepID=UPI0039A2D8CF
MASAENLVRQRLTGLVPSELLDDPEQAASRHAAAVWSCLTEPGDGVAGTLVAALGPRTALSVALEDGTDSVQDPNVVAARRRWLPRLGTVDDAFRGAQRAGVRLLTAEDDEWPNALDDLGPHAPRCLWVRGDLGTLSSRTPAVALVGARAATGYGEHVAMEMAAELAGSGITVVSGGAYGIDGMAHRAAIAAGGRTLAFLAGGVDRAYPAGHADLLARIAAGPGAVAAEVPCGTTPTKWRFLQRNRLIAAAAGATVVVEAGWRSGSLNTAGHAAALGRALGAVPGPVTSAASAGCHRLLREYDARCVTGADDVRELLGLTGAAVSGDDSFTGDRTRVLDALSVRVGRSAEEIARRSGFAPDDAQALLGMLELDGSAHRTADGWRRRPA